jgi:hypothetical protein
VQCWPELAFTLQPCGPVWLGVLSYMRALCCTSTSPSVLRTVLFVCVVELTTVYIVSFASFRACLMGSRPCRYCTGARTCQPGAAAGNLLSVSGASRRDSISVLLPSSCDPRKLCWNNFPPQCFADSLLFFSFMFSYYYHTTHIPLNSDLHHVW